MSIAANIRFLRALPKHSQPHTSSSRLAENIKGSNPGNLAMLTFMPDDLPEMAPLVVVLHGCAQSAGGYEMGSGWSTLAERYGFALLMPEQQRSNNANGCFNWFEPSDTSRGSGEALSIKQMIEQVITQYKLDKRRVFITGLSAGGAMTSAMLATYPDVFAGGAIIAGLPYGIARNLQEALSGMFQAKHRSPSELGDLVRQSSHHSGPWPKVSVWHGSSDRTVNPLNASYIVNQWLDVHRISNPPTSQDVVDGYHHQIWRGGNGEPIVEFFAIAGMEHGTPIGTAENGEQYGVEGAFLIDVGISSSYHIAKFFGLIGSIHRSNASEAPENKPHRWTVPHSVREPVSRLRPLRTFNINSTINGALKAAGLIK